MHWRDTIDVPHPRPMPDCPTCSGVGIEEMRVADADKVDITCRDCVKAEHQKLMQKAVVELRSQYGWDERTAASVMLTVTTAVGLAPKLST